MMAWSSTLRTNNVSNIRVIEETVDIFVELFRLGIAIFSEFSVIFIVVYFIVGVLKHYQALAESSPNKTLKKNAQNVLVSKNFHYVAQLIFKSNQLGFTLHIKNKLKSSFCPNKMWIVGLSNRSNRFSFALYTFPSLIAKSINLINIETHIFQSISESFVCVRACVCGFW